MAKSLTFETGIVDYDINGVKVRFNPTDENFIGKLQQTFNELDSLEDSLVDSADFEKFAELDSEMRGKIDGLLGDGTANALFPDMNCYAIADGMPVWLNLLFALFDEVYEACEREYGKSDARMKAWSGKYNKMMAKYRKPRK